jgi:beta-N-acetylhexosaminidase
MGFRGLIVTDAMNMGALNNLDNAPFQAVKAGCDMILMPVDEEKLLKAMLEEMQKDPDFKNQVYTSVKKIIRLKVLLGMFD